MALVRFAPKEEFKPGHPMFIEFIREVNGVRPGTFKAPDQNFNGDDFPRKGYFTEQYPHARIIHGPGDEGVRIVTTTNDPNVLAAFREAARNLNIHIAE